MSNLATRSSLSAIIALACTTLAAVAGPLNPPAGPVAPTQGPEPRTAINATNTPGVGQAKFTITQPGSYYLTGNLEVFNVQHGIQIDLNTDGLVTIDLNGFSIIGHDDTLSGIDVDAPFQLRVVIRNGFIMSFGGHGIDMTGTENATIENVESTRNGGKGFVLATGTLSNCKAQYNSQGGIVVASNSTLDNCHATQTGTIGIQAGDNCRITGCTVRNCGTRGIQTESNCVITDCIAANNTGYGIHTYLGCTLNNCAATSNGEAGFSMNQSATLIGCVSQNNTKAGFTSGGTCVFQSCVARVNGLSGFITSDAQITECQANTNAGDGFSLGGLSNISKCTSLSNDGHGISTGGACIIADCIALYNDKHGINCVLEGCTIRGNLCTGNGQGIAAGAGIHTETNSHRIEDNTCKDNDIGIDVDGARTIIIRNTCAGNTTTNWSIVAGNSYAPIIDRSVTSAAAVNGNAAASVLTTTDPNANFTN